MGGSIQLDRKPLGQDIQLDIDKEITDSSVRSNIQKVDLGEFEIETMEGTNVRQLSPITRKMNLQNELTIR